MKRITGMGLWVVAALPLLITIIMLPSMPDAVPAHYGLNGEVDRYDSKYVMVLFPLITLLLVAARTWAPRWVDHEDSANQANIAVIDRVMWPTVGVLVLLNFMTLWLAVTGTTDLYATGFDIPRLILMAVSGLFVVIGNVLPKTRPNWFVGIRVPWTVNYPEVWYRSHRVGGYLMTVSGVFGVGVAWLVSDPAMAAMLVIGGILTATVGMVGYSYVVYRQFLKHQDRSDDKYPHA